MSNTFINGESLASVRAKLNLDTLDNEKQKVKNIDYVAGADKTSGSVTGQASNSITDSTKSWTVNQFAGSVVRMVTAGGTEDFGIVQSNTSTSLVLDDNHAGYTFATYRVLDTLTATTINTIYSFNITGNDCGFVLPLVANLENRTFIKAYVEVATDSSKKVAIVCKGADRQRGRKFGFLQNRYEAVDLWVHQLAPNHWDLLAFENIKRYAAIGLNANQSVASTTYVNIVPHANAIADRLRRFDLLNISGTGWLKYQSISSLDFHASGSIIVTRSGGGASVVEVALRIKRFATGLTEETTKTAKVRFSGDSTQTAGLDIDFTLNPYDEVTIVAKRDAGTVTIEAGSNVVISEM